MSLASDFVAGVKPRLITRLTSGTGTFVPTVDMARCLVRIQAGGAGGASAGTNGGGAGAMVEAWIRVPIAGAAYAVGAAAAAATAGNKSYFDTIVAQPGATTVGNGGYLGNFPVSASVGNLGGSMGGASGGAGGQGTNGCSVGFSSWVTGQTLGFGLVDGTRGGGGDSFFGKGGNGNNAGVGVAGNGYGSGGGAGSTTGGAGPGGLIEIFDYGV